MEDKTYNGWKNYETWVTKLWMDNDQGSSEYYNELATNTYKHAKADTFTKLENARLLIMNTLKDEYEENVPQTTGVYADLLNASLSEIDWYEIAEALLSDVLEEVK